LRLLPSQVLTQCFVWLQRSTDHIVKETDARRKRALVKKPKVRRCRRPESRRLVTGWPPRPSHDEYVGTGRVVRNGSESARDPTVRAPPRLITSRHLSAANFIIPSYHQPSTPQRSIFSISPGRLRQPDNRRSSTVLNTPTRCKRFVTNFVLASFSACRRRSAVCSRQDAALQ
jgi:hypothetical protein